MTKVELTDVAEVVETVDEYFGNCEVCCASLCGVCDVFIFPPLFLKICTKTRISQLK
jgi:hypothetical protein